MDFRGFDSSRILILRGGVLRSIWSFPEISSQQFLVCRFRVWRLAVKFHVLLSTWQLREYQAAGRVQSLLALYVYYSEV